MKLAFDIELMRPACVLVAAGMGADSTVPARFPTESWLLSPTSDMKVYETSDEQLNALVGIVENNLEQQT